MEIVKHRPALVAAPVNLLFRSACEVVAFSWALMQTAGCVLAEVFDLFAH